VAESPSPEVFAGHVDVVLRGRGGLGRVRFTVGLRDLEGLFQPKEFYDSLVFCF